jgi:hypothetical protein
MLDDEQINALLGDKYAYRCLFNKAKDASKPCDWLTKCDPIKLTESFEDAVVMITLIGDEELEFEDCRLKDLSLEFSPNYAGQCAMSFKLYLQPGIGKENLQLQEHQNHEVRLTVTNATVMLKAKGRQKDLFAADGEGEGGHPDPDAQNTEELTHPEQLFEAPKGRGRKAKNGETRAH